MTTIASQLEKIIAWHERCAADMMDMFKDCKLNDVVEQSKKDADVHCKIAAQLREIYGILETWTPQERDAGRPHRKLLLKLTLGADDSASLAASLKDISFSICEEGMRGQSILGGYDRGWSLDVIEDDKMTHDEYMKRLDAHLKTEA